MPIAIGNANKRLASSLANSIYLAAETSAVITRYIPYPKKGSRKRDASAISETREPLAFTPDVRRPLVPKDPNILEGRVAEATGREL